MLDRRTMMTGAGAALGVAMSARSYAQIKGANDRLRVAVVGVNGRGQAHMGAFTKVPNVEITHFCDVDSAVLAKRAGEFAARGHAAPKTEGDYRRLLDTHSKKFPNEVEPWTYDAGEITFLKEKTIRVLREYCAGGRQSPEAMVDAIQR